MAGRLNHGVTFPLMDKIEVNGENAHPIFKWLYSEKPFEGFGESDTAKWNFTKLLVDRKGRVVARFEPTVTPEEMEAKIQELL